MYLKISFILLSLALSISSLRASYEDKNSAFSFGAEWIFFRPSLDCNTLLSANLESSVVALEELNIDTSYHSGWRIDAGYLFPYSDHSLSIRYTHFRSQDTRTFSAESFAGPNMLLNSPGTATDKLQIWCHVFEGLYNHKILCHNRFVLDLFGGVQCSWVGAKESILVFSFDLDAGIPIKEHSRFWGIGPEFGFNVDILLGCGFSLVGKGAGAFLVSRHHAEIETNFIGVLSQTTSRPMWKVVPAWNFRMGMRYDFFWSRCSLFVEGGYETLSYLHGLRRMQSVSQSFIFGDIDMHGPYITCGLIF